MTHRSNDPGQPEDMSFEELVARSSVGGDTDPALDDVCADEEANLFATAYNRQQAAVDAVVHAAEEVMLRAARESPPFTERRRTKQLVSAGVADNSVKQAFTSFRRAIDAVEYTHPPVLTAIDTPSQSEPDTITPTQQSVTPPNTTEIFTTLKSTTFHELVRSSMAGDQEAVATLFTWIRPVIVRYSRVRIGRSGSAYSAADDVAQEICMAVLGALSHYGNEPESFLPFVYGIAAHKVANHYRRTGRDRPDPAADVPNSGDLVASPEQQTMATDLRDRLEQLLATLPSRQREIVVLRLVVGLSAEETAAAVGLTPTAVRVTQHRALAKLRTVLSPAEWA